jgi:CDP-diacylglycerol--serine O-phosphatidyltransferase
LKGAWIPNTLTLGNLACGFVSIVYAGFGTWEGKIVAAVLILLAALLDGLDGQVARRLGVEGPMGKELDSLADCVTFGVSPAYLTYKTYLSGITLTLGAHPFDLGILIAVAFPVCAAYRLARFNVKSSPGPFTGLPSPIAGSLAALAPLTIPAEAVPVPLFAAFFLFIGFLMVSTVSYSKPQSVLLKNIQGLKLAGLVVLMILLVLRFRFRIILLAILLYVLSGLVSYVVKVIENRRY